MVSINFLCQMSTLFLTLRLLLKSQLSRFSCHPLLLAGAAALLGVGLAWCITYAPATSQTMGRTARRQTVSDIRRSLGTVATDTPKATAALAIGRAHLDSAEVHARRAVYYEQV